MKFVIIGLASLLVGFIAGMTYQDTKTGQSLAEDLARQSPTAANNTGRAANTNEGHQQEIKQLTQQIAKLKEIYNVSEQNLAEAMNQIQASQNSIASSPPDAVEQYSDESINNRKFEQAKSSFDREVEDAEWSANTTQTIESIIQNHENYSNIFYSNLKCRASQCYIELKQTQFNKDFEDVFFKITENKSLNFGAPVIDPIPSDSTTEMQDFRIIFKPSEAMN